ncbi:STAS domain-containing protein [Bacillus sp. ISL-45]|uniref:STAS domain-containing protein n=1 Tax=Bacillus sp. ISL-45 TaxID=2819128 RepID=UPI001BE5432F|nr:STAS domain-containing protein [Bacillus sp. ISL-45]MBT2663867.1 STAS domain-containing protein [Bacillus sp. ISL-45]
MIEVKLNPNGEYLEVSIIGDLDIDSTELVEDELLPELGKYKIINLIFSDVPFVDSSGMGLLINLVQSLSEKGIKVTISNVRDDVMEVFELLQLPDILGDQVFV